MKRTARFGRRSLAHACYPSYRLQDERYPDNAGGFNICVWVDLNGANSGAVPECGCRDRNDVGPTMGQSYQSSHSSLEFAAQDILSKQDADFFVLSFEPTVGTSLVAISSSSLQAALSHKRWRTHPRAPPSLAALGASND